MSGNGVVEKNEKKLASHLRVSTEQKRTFKTVC